MKGKPIQTPGPLDQSGSTLLNDFNMNIQTLQAMLSHQADLFLHLVYTVTTRACPSG
jgi:hypothetical protein